MGGFIRQPDKFPGFLIIFERSTDYGTDKCVIIPIALLVV